MKLIALEQAQRIVHENVHPLESIQVPLQAALGCVVATDVTATVDSPSVDASLKDGFAVRAADLAEVGVDGPVVLELVGTSTAGAPVQAALEPGQTIKVTTGAPLPPQADAVVPVEQVEEDKGGIKFTHPVPSGRDVLPTGSDVAQNQLVATIGDRVTPGLLGLLAAAGHSRLSVIRPPQVAILSTGDEVVAPGSPLPDGKLYASNLTTLEAWCRKLGFGTKCLIVGDSAAETTQSIQRIIGWADAVLTSGGAWKSERDVVAGALESLKWQQLFPGVRLRPGKGSGFGLLARKPVFMLPGGPSANLTAFLQLALPGLMQMAGCRQKGLPEVMAELKSEIKSRHVDWSQFVYGKLKSHDNGYRFEPLHISSRLQSMAKADACALVPEGEMNLSAGSYICVQMLSLS